MVGPFDPRRFAASARFCRVGKLANAIRSRVHELRRGDVPFSTWHSQAHWEGLYDVAGVSAHTCTVAAGMARDRALSDWAVECDLAQVAQREIPEDWDSRAWEFPDDPLVDARSRHLDAVTVGFHQYEEFAMFADGGEDTTCCTYAGGLTGGTFSSLTEALYSPSFEHVPMKIRPGRDQPPLWRQDQLAHPERWTIAEPLPGGGVRDLCHIAHCDHGLVGIDISRRRLRTGTILQSSGGYLMQEALKKWRLRTVQGKCCSTPGIFAQGLDIRLFTTGCATVERRAWTLEKDTPHTDISPFAYRCIRAIGGSWTERLHADPALKRLGQSWAQLSGHPLRTCPLCRTRPGTPRHVIMACPAMEALVNRLRDDLERALGRVATSPELIQAANRANLTRKVAAEGTAQRWPILSAWKWFVPLSSEIEDFGHDEESSSRAVTNAEQGHDLAYRGIMPQELGRFLRRHGQPTCHRSQPEEDAPDEQFGSFLDLQGAADELAAISVRCVQAVGAAIGPLRLLMLGLRCVRAEYLQRLDAWASAMTVSLNESTAPAGPLLPRPPAAPDRAHIWLRTPEGRSLLKELRWLAPDRHTAVHRLRSVLRSNQSNDRLAEILTEFGAPMRTGAVLSWGASQVGWSFLHGMLGHHPLPWRLPVEPRLHRAVGNAYRASWPDGFDTSGHSSFRKQTDLSSVDLQKAAFRGDTDSFGEGIRFWMRTPSSWVKAASRDFELAGALDVPSCQHCNVTPPDLHP
ncbi:unnamed protein product [Symbiodinium microadriaticum]|nr:unnamed protein product [Symbiodinium microadriaticum]